MSSFGRTATFDPIRAWAPRSAGLPGGNSAGRRWFWRGYTGRPTPDRFASEHERRAFRAGELRRQNEPGLTPEIVDLRIAQDAQRMTHALRAAETPRRQSFGIA